MTAPQRTAEEMRRSRKSVILAVIHALLAVAILAGFVYVQGSS